MNKHNIEIILNQIKTNIYITDIHTNKIIFMNENMKEEYSILAPEGKVCWEVLCPEKIFLVVIVKFQNYWRAIKKEYQ
ncbi:hypothetical protein ACTPEO_11955 [Clostridioides difficile]